MLAPDLALVYKSLLPACFVQELTKRGVHMIDVPADEFGLQTIHTFF